MLDFIVVPLVVGMITLGIYKFFELIICRRERLNIIEKLDPGELIDYLKNVPLGLRLGRGGAEGVGGGRFPVSRARLHPRGTDDGIGQAPFVHELAASRRGGGQHQTDAGPQDEEGPERDRVHRPA